MERQQPSSSKQNESKSAAESSQWEVDAVCGMDVDASDPDTEKSERKGKTYYFCSSECRQQFESNPSEYGG